MYGKKRVIKKEPISFEVKEKIAVILFLIFSIIAVMILFRAPYQAGYAGHVVFTEELGKNIYNAGERLNGSISIALQDGDLLPRNAKIEFFISSNSTNCSAKYVCPSIGTIDWHRYENNECILIEPDPEGKCCRNNQANCIQIIYNSGFEELRGEIGSLPLYWVSNTSGAESIELVYSEVIDYDDGTSTSVAVTSSEDLQENGYVAIKQTFTGSRKIKISDLLKTESPFCTDFDSGRNYTIKGNCTDNSGVYNESSINTTYLREYYCENNVCRNESYDCRNIGVNYKSSNGICVQGCYDSDGGINYNVAGSCTNATGSYVDSCFGNNVIEKYCSSNRCSSRTYDCTSVGKICQDGKCVYEGGDWPDIFGDSDGGINYTATGTCTDSTGSYTDLCTISGLKEYYYDYATSSCLSQIYPCPLGCGTGVCSQTIFSGTTYAITGFAVDENQEYNSLNYSFIYDPYDISTCAFEVVIKSENGKNLHYYYKMSNNCAMPQNNADNFYIEMNIPNANEGEGFLTMAAESLNLYKNWTNAGFNANENISEIWLISHGKFIGDNKGQIIMWDDVKITKPNEISDSCTQRGKACCSSGTGVGDYYEQFSCSENKECWNSCTSKKELILSQFVSNSNTPTKRNITRGEFQYIRDDIINKIAYGEIGEGYAACSRNTGYCSGWNNEYVMNLNRINLNAPRTNGSYELIARIVYTPESEDCYSDEDNNIVKTCIIDEQSISFNVGRVEAGCTENWVCSEWNRCNANEIQNKTCSDLNNCGTTSRKPSTSRQCCVENWIYGNWGECIDGTRTKTSTDENNCSTNFNLNNTWDDPACFVIGEVPCIELDYNCSGWSSCINRTQIRNCELKADSECDENHIRTSKPLERRTCEQEEPLWTGGISLSILIPIVILLALLAVFLVWKLASKKSDGIQLKPKENYPELVSYIRDASAAGATRQEIIEKLTDAGWPRDAIDDAFKSAR